MKAIEDNVISEVCAICADTLRIPLERVVPQARLVEDLDVDSLFVVQLALALEERFGVQISEDELTAVKSVQDLVTYLATKLEAA